MPQLICLVQRCNLADGRLIREGEKFEVTQEEANNLMRGGTIAKLVAKPVEKPAEIEVVPARIVEKQEADDEAVQAPEIKRRRRVS